MTELNRNKKVLDAVSMASNQTSDTFELNDASGYCVHSIFTGAPVGSLIVEASNDGTNFVAEDTHAVSAAGQRLYNKDGAYYKYVRVRYSFTSGTGSLTSYVSSKG